MADAERRDFERALEEALDQFPNELAEPLVLHGNPVRRILEQEEEKDCDLIIVGKRQNRIQDFFLGSVTRRVLADSQCDVLISV